MTDRKIIIRNNTAYSILSVITVRYSRVKPGTIERTLRGEHTPDWLMHYTEYHVKVKNKNENFDRTFVLTEREAKNELSLLT